MELLLIDNYDSFTYNLYQMLGEAGASVRVRYNDAVIPSDIAKADAIVISPGPGAPEEAGQCLDIIREHGHEMPILGVCLGHQCIAQAFGGRVVRAGKLMHGKTSQILHNGCTIYAGLPSPLTVGRYHSLIVEERNLPRDFEVTSYTKAGEIMGIRHRSLPVEGVQFHPESILTSEGARLLRNFIDHVRATTSVAIGGRHGRRHFGKNNASATSIAPVGREQHFSIGV
ncbi:MAG: aminodeoxychorismate/anthranilate synthase component II [Planctomycetes bacterium]|nr:aminodeoxychorismate/anthranilate synthase component II [Planctomycetota bacterium]